MGKGPDLNKWKEFRLRALNEAEYIDQSNPLIELLSELKLYDVDDLIYQAQELIYKSEDTNLPPVERNSYKSKIEDLSDALRNVLGKLSELDQF